MLETQTNNQATRQVDIAVIGAGTAGQNAFKHALKMSDNVVIINDGYWTTTCATVGCMPSKLLLAAAERAHHAEHSEDFGIHAEVSVNGKEVMRRVQNERNRFAGFVQEQVDGWDNNKKISGYATITPEGLIKVNDELIQAKHIMVATGSKPFVPEGWAENLGERLLTSDSVFELADLPESLAVVGTGAIGLELAYAFTLLGVKTKVFNRSNRVGGLQDDKVNEKAIQCFSKTLDMALDSDITKVSNNGQHAIIDYLDEQGNQQSFKADYVLAAVGRRQTLDTLGVENLGVTLDKKGRPLNWCDKTGRVGNLNVYIIGDANAHLPLLHVASQQGLIAGLDLANSMAKQDSKHDDLHNDLPTPFVPMAVVFSKPQIASVGYSLAELQKMNKDIVIGEVSFDNQGRSRVMGVNCGLLRIYADKHTAQILGASMVAPDAEYMAHILATAMTHQQTVYDLLAAPFYHPTILEGLRTALRDTKAQL